MRSPDVDIYISRSTQWPDEMTALRTILLDGGELQEFKELLSLMFFKGALLSDPAGVLRSQGENSRSALRLEFRSVEDVTAMSEVVRDYVAEAIEVEDAGLTVEPAPELELVEELRLRLEADPELRAAFEGLTPGRQREYHLHISGAKQAATRESRIDTCTPRILAGKGLRDR